MPKRIIIDIRRSELHAHRASFWPWEIPIVDFIHSGNIKPAGEEDCDNRVLDPVNEFERLERRFGFDKETHVLRVHAVYGMPPLGIQKLAEAMRGHLEEQAEIDATRAEAQDIAAAAAELEPPGDAPAVQDAPADTAEETEQPRARRRASS